MGGIKNGKLMAFCVENNFEILLTIDKNTLYQQNIEKYSISLIVFDAKRSNLAELLPFHLKFQIKAKKFRKAQGVSSERTRKRKTFSLMKAERFNTLSSTDSRAASSKPVAVSSNDLNLNKR